MVDVQNVTKSYGAVRALSDVSFRIEAGTIVGLLGPNGAGKSTLMKILTGYLQPDDGQVSIEDFDVLTQRRQAQERIGYLPENAPLYPELTVQEYLLMISDVRRIAVARQRDAIRSAVRATGLEPVLTRPIQQLSKGYRQRVGIAQAILHRPKLLILDEPTVGLDPTQLAEIRELIRDIARTSTVLFSSHILPEVEALCDRAVMIMGGVIRADAQLSELAKSGAARVVLDAGADPKRVADALGAVPGAGSVMRDAAARDRLAFVVRGTEGSDLCPAIFELAKREDWPVRELRSETRTLETVFNELAREAAPVPHTKAAPSQSPSRV